MATRRQRQILRNRKLEFEQKVTENRKKATKRGKKEAVVEEPKEAPKKKGKK